MSQELDATLRKSLDDVDRIRKRQRAAMVFFMLAFVAAVIWLAHLSRSSSTDVRTVLGAAVFVIAAELGYCTFALTLHISRMTRRILKAIELSSKP
jgi:hypothetical protein